MQGLDAFAVYPEYNAGDDVAEDDETEECEEVLPPAERTDIV